MSDIVLVINAGSSSLKFATFAMLAGEAPSCVARGEINGLGAAPHAVMYDRKGVLVDERKLQLSTEPALAHDEALTWLIDWLGQTSAQPLLAVGHRVVHGGSRYAKPVRITPDVLTQLQQLVPLAPLHQPHNLAVVRAIMQLKPDLPQVACFDTAFHATQPWLAQTFALPRRFWEMGIKRYGFHGLSYEYIASVLPNYLGARADGHVIVAHLGNGASLCAMRTRRSVATTMGFTTLDGLMMGTRCGNLDPGVLLFLMNEKHMTFTEVERLLYHESGLLGVSGVSADMRALERSSERSAKSAIDLYVYRIVHELGALAGVLGGLDALVFTAGVGEHSALIRERVCRDAAWLGVEIDENANRANHRRISTVDSRVSTWVIPTNEELMIAQHTLVLLGTDSGSLAQ